MSRLLASPFIAFVIGVLACGTSATEALTTSAPTPASTPESESSSTAAPALTPLPNPSLLTTEVPARTAIIIDQPEESLDPKSVYDELVWRFSLAKMRRQIIIVTHNANLVVNTDADQVIVATAGNHRPGTLPEITYKSGGLESSTIRQLVCEILEGGEHAFRERARRLRLEIDRPGLPQTVPVQEGNQ